ncbi:hypothetical protein AB7W14_21035 [Providencia rettgeri]|uniref:hypothetical protein n=1 Tax=Providencia TaxID=586 RepID=UPI00234BA7FA|nr:MULTISPECIES: hypothetical protein [unclassified Providencia]
MRYLSNKLDLCPPKNHGNSGKNSRLMPFSPQNPNRRFDNKSLTQKWGFLRGEDREF